MMVDRHRNLANNEDFVGPEQIIVGHNRSDGGVFQRNHPVAGSTAQHLLEHFSESLAGQKLWRLVVSCRPGKEITGAMAECSGNTLIRESHGIGLRSHKSSD